MSAMAWKAVAVMVLSTILLGLPACGVMFDSDAAGAPGFYDRPALVRGPARAGSVIGGITGLVVALVFWPINKGLNLLFDEPLGYSEKEWALLPITTTAAVGHHALGLPGELLHYVFYRAWVPEPVPVDFDHLPTGPGR